jgi:hypothetical protein
MMNSNWQNTLNELKEYIAVNSEVVMKHDTVAIPEGLKPEFYRLFDKVRLEIVQAKLGELLDRAQELSSNYIAIEETICKRHKEKDLPQRKQIDAIKKTLSSPFERFRDRLGFGGFKFDEITLDDELRIFLLDPPKALSRVLYEPLFDLLKGKIEFSDFELAIKEKLPAAFRQLYHSGYEKWAILNLLKSFRIGTAYEAINPVITRRQIMKQNIAHIVKSAEPPALKQTKVLMLKSTWDIHALCESDLILKPLNKKVFVGIKSGFKRGASDITHGKTLRPTLPFNSVVSLQQDMPLLLYVGDRSSDVSIVAGNTVFLRPDIVIQCRENEDLWNNAEIERVALVHNALQPLIGTFLISGPFAAENNIQATGITTINAGFNPSLLSPIIDCLALKEMDNTGDR